MIRLLLGLAASALMALTVGYLFTLLLDALDRRQAARAARSEPLQRRRLGIRWLFVCWLICSAAVTALIWEYWY
ncbi:MAG: hypothetical protein KDI71_15780 [Xanthomonadales bacterium]|nr:hypothetical protein [Xanthomonadales bacterium]